MADYLFTFVSLVAVVFVLIPAYFHSVSRNYGALYMTGWVTFVNFVDFVNSILWANDVDEKANTWCYITSPLYIAAHHGLVASVTCMIHTLYTYVSSSVILTERVRRRQAIVDGFICIGLPLVLMGLTFLVQTNRYAIRPVMGCFSPVMFAWPSLVIYFLPPVFFSFAGSFYAVRTSVTIVKKRLEIQSLLRYRDTGLNKAKFYRLVFFCISFLLIVLPSTLLVLRTFFANKIVPYSWTASKKNWHNVRTFEQGVYVFDYAKPLTALLIFCFFGTGQDAMAGYRRWGRKIKLDRMFPSWFVEFEPTESYATGAIRSGSRKQGLSSGRLGAGSDSSSYGSDAKFLRTGSTSDLSSTVASEGTTDSKFKKYIPNFLISHRTPSEQAAIDMTSGLRFQITGIDTRTINVAEMNMIEEEQAPPYESTADIADMRESRPTIVVSSEKSPRSDEKTRRVTEVDVSSTNRTSATTAAVLDAYMRDSVVSSVGHINDLLSVYPDQESSSSSTSGDTDNTDNQTGFAL